MKISIFPHKTDKLFMVIFSLVVSFSLLSANQKSLKHGIESVTQVSLSMSGVGAIHYKGNLNRKLDNLKEKAKNIDRDEANDVQEGVGSIGDGLDKLVNGIKEGSWKDVLSGGLDIIGAVIGLVGTNGALFSAVLSLLSSCFGIFGGITGDSESTEDMLKRVIEAALDENTADSIKAQSNAVKKLFTSMQYVIATYREQKTRLSNEQAMKLYDLLFTGVEIFGEIEFYVKKWCEIDNSVTGKTKLHKIEQDAVRCLDLLNLYCDLSILRQLLLADMSSVLAAVNNTSAAETIVQLVEKEQKADSNFLKILADLTNNKEYRFINNILHSSQEKYPTIYIYLSNLKKALLITESKNKRSTMLYHPMTLPKDRPKLSENPFYKTRFTIDKKYVLICSEKNLKGYCYEVTKTGYFRNKKMKGWENKISSIYVAGGLKVTGYHVNNIYGVEFGPYYGPSVYGCVAAPEEWGSFKIDETVIDSNQQVRVCEKENLDQTSICETFGKDEYDKLYKVKIKDESGVEIATTTYRATGQKEECDSKCSLITGGKRQCVVNRYGRRIPCFIGKDWKERIKSMYIPKGFEVRLYTKEAFASEKTYGPFMGPLKIHKFPENLLWKSMKIWESTYKSSVKICTGENLSGFCDHIQVPDDVKWPLEEPRIDTIHGIPWTEPDHKIMSVHVPGGAALQIFSEMNYDGVEVGPYTGPKTIKRVDGDGDMIIKSIKLHKLY